MTETVYTVTGMTCGHCASAVQREVSKLAGVQDVAVDVPMGIVTVQSETELNRGEVATAIDEAGYELTEPASA